jgi:uncharacterized protein (DUF362 family)
MDRRNFLKTAAAAALYLSARRVFPQAASGAAEVGIVTGTDIEKAVSAVLDLVGGIRRYVKPGSIVTVKPNIGFNQPPEMKATTDPLIVRTVIHLCFQAGASKVWLFDRSTGNSRLSYVTSGIAKAAEEAGASVIPVDDVSTKTYKTMSVRDGLVLKETMVVKQALESDVFINLPVAKNHGSSILTLGMKNLMGITGDNRSRWHWQLHESITDINTIVKSHLVLIDATYLMLRNGPTGGSRDYLKRMDTLIASSNVIAADTEGAKLFGKTPKDVPHIAFGEKQGVGKTSGYTVATGRV